MHRVMISAVMVALIVPACAIGAEFDAKRVENSSDGFALAAEMLNVKTEKSANEREAASASGGAAFEGILGLIGEMKKTKGGIVMAAGPVPGQPPIVLPPPPPPKPVVCTTVTLESSVCIGWEGVACVKWVKKTETVTTCK